MKKKKTEKIKVLFKFEVVSIDGKRMKYRLKGRHIPDVIMGLEWAKAVMIRNMTQKNEENIIK